MDKGFQGFLIGQALYVHTGGPNSGDILAHNRPFGYALRALSVDKDYRRCGRARPLRSLLSASFQQVEKIRGVRVPVCLATSSFCQTWLFLSETSD